MGWSTTSSARPGEKQRPSPSLPASAGHCARSSRLHGWTAEAWAVVCAHFHMKFTRVGTDLHTMMLSLHKYDNSQHITVSLLWQSDVWQLLDVKANSEERVTVSHPSGMAGGSTSLGSKMTAPVLDTKAYRKCNSLAVAGLLEARWQALLCRCLEARTTDLKFGGADGPRTVPCHEHFDCVISSVRSSASKL